MFTCRYSTVQIPQSPYWKRNPSDEYTITGVSSLNRPMDATLLFANQPITEFPDISGSIIILIPGSGALSSTLASRNCILVAPNPRLAYAVLLSHILAGVSEPEFRQLCNGSFVATTAIVAEGAKIGHSVYVGHKSVIGAGTIVKSGAKIAEFVLVGENCIIGENTVIGNQGFGVERTPTGDSVRIPHVGGVIIGDSVYVGALNTIVAGTIAPTIVEDHVQTDDHVHIAHNCHIKRGTHITACVEISGSVTIGEKCTIGPNASLMNKISIGASSTVGLGAVVTKSFGEGVTLAGNPADIMDNIRALRRALNSLMAQDIRVSL